MTINLTKAEIKGILKIAWDRGNLHGLMNPDGTPAECEKAQESDIEEMLIRYERNTAINHGSLKRR
jgi:hypothetical protein